MSSHAKYAQVDNYLDLYLYAKQLHDHEWQEEIKRKLAELQNGRDDFEKLKEKDLQEQFTYVNRRILNLYQQLRSDAQFPADDLRAELFTLKQRRIELGKEIDRLRVQNQRIC